MPGLIWPVTAFQMRDTVDVRGILDRAVENCRLYGGDWELGCALMFRTHMVVDSPGGLHGVDDDLAELRVLSLRVGDRWMRAQVCGAAAEADHGTDVAPDGTGTVVEQRTYQLIRQRGPIADRLFEIEFFDAGVEAYCLTFG